MANSAEWRIGEAMVESRSYEWWLRNTERQVRVQILRAFYNAFSSDNFRFDLESLTHLADEIRKGGMVELDGQWFNFVGSNKARGDYEADWESQFHFTEY